MLFISSISPDTPVHTESKLQLQKPKFKQLNPHEGDKWITLQNKHKPAAQFILSQIIVGKSRSCAAAPFV